jgi:hypothetical protein
MYRLAADLLLFIHSLFVFFIIAGFLAVNAGIILKKDWVRSFRFRFLHLVSISYVVAETWLGKLCPLTDLENWLRIKSGGGAYGRTFVSYWLDKLIYYDFDIMVFQAVYTLFGILVLLQWIICPPRLHLKRRNK